MSDPIAIKYRAFLSYSHKDTRWARWLHAKLERFRIDKDLVGRETVMGPIPSTLRPVFRDRDDFTAGHTLSEQTVAALDASAALIALCSPAAAKSHNVDEEIRLFKFRHPDRPVIPVIVGGIPDDPLQDCFAPALKFKIGPQGQIGSVSDVPLGADVRDQADGRDLTVAKTIARLLGLQTDDVFRRAERERRRQARLRTTIGLLIAGLVATATLLAWQSYQRQQTIAEVEAVIAKYNIANSPVAAIQGANESLSRAVTAIAEGSAVDSRYADALELLKAGKSREAEPLLKAVAEETEARAIARFERGNKQAAAAYKNLAAITKLTDPKKAREIYAKAAELNPDDTESLYWSGRLQLMAGNLELAKQAFDAVLTHDRGQSESYETWWSRLNLGLIALRQGEPIIALETFRQAKSTAESMSKADATNRNWQYSLAQANEGIGFALEALDKFDEALNAFRDCVVITERLAQARPNDVEAQRSLSASLGSLGAVLQKQGDLPGALNTFQRSLSVIENVVKPDSTNIYELPWLMEALGRVGDVLAIQGNNAEALKYFEQSVRIGTRLVDSDTSNVFRHLDLAWAFLKAGALQDALLDREGSLESIRHSIDLGNRVATLNPHEESGQELLASAHTQAGEVLLSQNRITEAVANFESGAARDNANAMMRLGALYYDGSGVAQDYIKARAWFEKAAARDNALAMYRFGELYEYGLGVAQDFGKAREWYEKAAAIGHPAAMTSIGSLYANGQGVTQDYGKAREWYEKAADAGNDTAMANLGLAYANGTGVAQDFGQAREWFEKAAAAGNGDALGNLSWFALLARDDAMALDAAERGLKATPDAIVIETNRAHALMYLGRQDEARAVYLAHKDMPIPGQETKIWQQVIAEDYDTLRKNGREHPQMAEIEKLLGLPAR